MVKNKTNHENTKQGKHKIIFLSFSCFRDKFFFHACTGQVYYKLKIFCYFQF